MFVMGHYDEGNSKRKPLPRYDGRNARFLGRRVFRALSQRAKQVNSSKPDGVYSVGEDIYIDVYMSSPVVRTWWSKRCCCRL